MGGGGGGGVLIPHPRKQNYDDHLIDLKFASAYYWH